MIKNAYLITAKINAAVVGEEAIDLPLALVLCTEALGINWYRQSKLILQRLLILVVHVVSSRNLLVRVLIQNKIN